MLARDVYYRPSNWVKEPLALKVVVTGGAGFIGANLCLCLERSAAVDEIVAFDDLSTGSKANLATGTRTELVEASILDREALAMACRRADAIVHLAARPSVPRSITDPMASHAVNVTGTANVLEAARAAGNAHTLVASSSSVYGANPELPKHEGLKPSPLSPYAATKLATETYALAWQQSFGLPVLAFRFFNVFGPLQSAGHAYAAVIPAFIAAALNDEPLQVHGDGTQTRDFTYVGTVTRVLTEAVLRRSTASEPVNLAFGSRTSLLDVINILEGMVGRPLERAFTDPRAGDVPHSQADNATLRSIFPDIQPETLETGLAHTLAWARTGVVA